MMEYDIVEIIFTTAFVSCVLTVSIIAFGALVLGTK